MVAGGDTPEVLETAKHAFDEIAPFVNVWVERVEPLSGWIVRNNGLCAAFDEKAAQAVCIIGGVCGAKLRRGQRAEKGHGGADIAELPRHCFDGDGAAERIADGVDFCRAAAARATDRLARRPPLWMARPY